MRPGLDDGLVPVVAARPEDAPQDPVVVREREPPVGPPRDRQDVRPLEQLGVRRRDPHLAGRGVDLRRDHGRHPPAGVERDPVPHADFASAMKRQDVTL